MMDCAQFEILLADEVDGLLDSPSREAERVAFARHRESCAACAELAAEVRSAVDFMGRSADVEPPAQLHQKILQATNSGWELKLRGSGFRGWINRTFAPVLKPRIVMGAMLTLLSVTMLSRCGGAQKATLTAADLDPVRLWSSLDDRTHRVWVRAVKSYESMRLVYEIKTQLDEWSQQQTENEEAAADARADQRKLAAPDAAGNNGTDRSKK